MVRSKAPRTSDTVTVYMRQDFLQDQVRWMTPTHPLTPILSAAVVDGSQLQSSFLHPRERHRVLPLLFALADEGIAPGREFRAYAHLAQLFDFMSSSALADSSAALGSRTRSFTVDLAIALIDSDPVRQWNVHELARAVSISPSQLTRLFQKHLRVSPGVYIREQRLYRLSELLSENRLSVSAAARHAGWTSRSAASRSFKARFGVSPRSFTSSSSAIEPTHA